MRRRRKSFEALVNLPACFINQPTAKQVLLPLPPLSMYQDTPCQQYFSNFSKWHILTQFSKNTEKKLCQKYSRSRILMGWEIHYRKMIFKNPHSPVQPERRDTFSFTLLLRTLSPSRLDRSRGVDFAGESALVCAYIASCIEERYQFLHVIVSNIPNS